MIEEPKSLRIGPDVGRRPSVEQVAAFQGVPTGFVVDAMFGVGAMCVDISPLDTSNVQVAGPALTAENRPSDILATLGCLRYLKAGDVLIGSAQGWQGCAAAGDRVAGMAKNAGAVAFVTDGPMRDYDGILEVGLPCWCTGLNPGSPFGTGPGQVGTRVMVGGQPVETGDMIVADRDGVVVVPFAKIDDVAARLGAIQDMELELDAEVRKGLVLPDPIAALLDSDKTEVM
ncbi:4-hydroxy-4-methyl-2-oxoglutarate aldolase [Litoreibacter meonggei]|uniref:Putative 4-hydroxy-4-methyl-2-oxoglutarate aldolase n=1 Tax=Litoreibacter meonggei TaxID=1049199 RepID=A0A497X5D4_9RHOB|nr:RraA family protein [Litoreibacter meonggei]RLJ60498.1 4-hydroxy-4-methyl-2-oxoglutarate aldolase [Litoreibacter meonggei]